MEALAQCCGEVGDSGPRYSQLTKQINYHYQALYFEFIYNDVFFKDSNVIFCCINCFTEVLYSICCTISQRFQFLCCIVSHMLWFIAQHRLYIICFIVSQIFYSLCCIVSHVLCCIVSQRFIIYVALFHMFYVALFHRGFIAYVVSINKVFFIFCSIVSQRLYIFYVALFPRGFILYVGCIVF